MLKKQRYIFSAIKLSTKAAAGLVNSANTGFSAVIWVKL